MALATPTHPDAGPVAVSSRVRLSVSISARSVDAERVSPRADAVTTRGIARPAPRFSDFSCSAPPRPAPPSRRSPSVVSPSLLPSPTPLSVFPRDAPHASYARAASRGSKHPRYARRFVSGATLRTRRRPTAIPRDGRRGTRSAHASARPHPRLAEDRPPLASARGRTRRRCRRRAPRSPSGRGWNVPRERRDFRGELPCERTNSRREGKARSSARMATAEKAAVKAEKAAAAEAVATTVEKASTTEEVATTKKASTSVPAARAPRLRTLARVSNPPSPPGPLHRR